MAINSLKYQVYKILGIYLLSIIVAACSGIRHEGSKISEEYICDRDDILERAVAYAAQWQKHLYSGSNEITEIVFDCNKAHIARLYKSALKINPGINGAIVLEFTLSTEGEVTNLLISRSELNDSDFEEKLLEIIKLFKFPKSMARIIFTYPVDFTSTY